MMSSFKALGETKIDDDEHLTYAGAVGALMNGTFRIIWASLLDFYPFNKIFSILICIQIILISIVYTSLNHKWLFFLVIVFSMMCEGAMGSILPTIALTKFGTNRG